MNAQEIKNTVLPLFVIKTKASADVNPYSAHPPIVDKARYNQIMDQNILLNNTSRSTSWTERLGAYK